MSGQWTVRRTTGVIVSRFQRFSVAGPQAWNQLPTPIRQLDCIATFKRHLKTSLLWKRTVCVQLTHYF